MGKYKAKINKNEVKEKKLKKIKNKPILSDTQIEIRRFVRIVIITIVLVVAVYCCSVAVVNKRNSESTNTTTAETDIQYSNISVGMILNRPYDEYYVIVYDSTDNNAAYYQTIVYNYTSNEDALKIYTCDLNNGLNSAYAAGESSSNPDAKKIADLKFGEITLLHIKNSKINKYVEDITSIEDLLK